MILLYLIQDSASVNRQKGTAPDGASVEVCRKSRRPPSPCRGNKGPSGFLRGSHSADVNGQAACKQGFSVHWKLWKFVKVTTTRHVQPFTLPSVLLADLFSTEVCFKTSGDNLCSTAYLAALLLTIWRHGRPFCVSASVTFPLPMCRETQIHAHAARSTTAQLPLFTLFNHVDLD